MVAEQKLNQAKLEYERTISNLRVEKRNLRAEVNGLNVEKEELLTQLEEALGGAGPLEILNSGMARQEKMVKEII